MTQLDLAFARAPYVPVWVKCPRCAWEWLTAITIPGTFWGETPERIATRPFCRCGQKPPMVLVTRKEQAA